MPLTTDCTITGTWPQVDGVPATGHVIVEPVESVASGGYIIVDVPITVQLVAGSISKLFTSAAGVQLRITERIRGARVNEEPYVVTPIPGTLNLATAPRGTGDVVPTYIPGSAIGQPGGVAGLGGDGKVPLAQLPAVGASSLVVRQAYISDLGRLTLPDTAGVWLPLAGFPTLSIPAAVGDYVDVDMTALKQVPQDNRLDLAVLAGGALVRFMATGNATPGTEGDSGWISSGFKGRVSPRGFTVQAGDRTAGNVVFCMALRNDGTGTLDASTNYPFYWRAMNYGVVS